MYADARTARLLVWDAAHAVDTGDPEAMAKAYHAKTGAVDIAIRNARQTVKLMGGYGVAAKSAPARFLADAWTGYPVDGTRDLMGLDMLDYLLQLRSGPSEAG